MDIQYLWGMHMMYTIHLMLVFVQRLSLTNSLSSLRLITEQFHETFWGRQGQCTGRRQRTYRVIIRLIQTCHVLRSRKGFGIFSYQRNVADTSCTAASALHGTLDHSHSSASCFSWHLQPCAITKKGLTSLDWHLRPEWDISTLHSPNGNQYLPCLQGNCTESENRKME